MKQLLSLLFMMIALFALPLVVLSQGFEGSNETEVITTYFVSLSAMAGAILICTQFIKRFIKLNGIQIKVVSWLCGIGLAYFGWWLNIGFLENVSGLEALIFGVASVMISHGIFEVRFVKALLELILTKKS